MTGYEMNQEPETGIPVSNFETVMPANGVLKRSNSDEFVVRRKTPTTPEKCNNSERGSRGGVLGMLLDFFGLKVGRTDASTAVGEIVATHGDAFEEAGEKELGERDYDVRWLQIFR